MGGGGLGSKGESSSRGEGKNTLVVPREELELERKTRRGAKTSAEEEAGDHVSMVKSCPSREPRKIVAGNPFQETEGPTLVRPWA